MGRFSPNYGPNVQYEERNPLFDALTGIAEGYLTGREMKADLADRAANRVTNATAREYRPIGQAGAPMLEARPAFPTAKLPNGLEPTTGTGLPSLDPSRTPNGNGGLGIRREDYSVQPVDNSTVDNALRTSDEYARYFGAVDARSADLQSRPGIDVNGERYIHAPERVAEERGMDRDRELNATLRAIEGMRASGELDPDEVTDARLRARGIARPRPTTGLTFEQRAALQDIIQQDRLDAIAAQGGEARATRATPSASTYTRTPPVPARDKFVQDRYQHYLDAQDRYGSPLYTPQQAREKAEQEAAVQFGAGTTVTPPPADTGRAARLRARLGQ